MTSRSRRLSSTSSVPSSISMPGPGAKLSAAQGATIFASAPAKRYFETVFAQPTTPAPEALARPNLKPDLKPNRQPGRQPGFVAVEGKTVLGDAGRLVEIHELKDSIHARGLLVVWLPREQLLIEADAYTPGAADAPPPAVLPAVPNANHLNLVQNLDRLGLAPKRILPLHGRVVPASDLYMQVGRKPPP